MVSPPSSSLVKINFNGALFTKIGETKLGVIICDSQRLVLAFLAKKVPLPHPVDVVEAMVVVRALSFAQ